MNFIFGSHSWISIRCKTTITPEIKLKEEQLQN